MKVKFDFWFRFNDFDRVNVFEFYIENKEIFSFSVLIFNGIVICS